MNTQKQEIINFLKHGAKAFLPHISIDCVIFGFTGERLVILALQPLSTSPWFMPGDFVAHDESIESAAYRAMREKLGVDEIYLRQFKAFGEADRSFAGEMATYFAAEGIEASHYAWMTKRFVTIGYYACVDYHRAVPSLPPFFLKFRWIDIDQLDGLGFDHANIVREARRILSKDLADLPVIAKLLPAVFTIPELRKLHEAILGRPIDRGNFRQKILKSNILEKVGERQTPETRRPPGLYRFNWKDYEAKLEEGVKIGF